MQRGISRQLEVYNLSYITVHREFIEHVRKGLLPPVVCPLCPSPPAGVSGISPPLTVVRHSPFASLSYFHQERLSSYAGCKSDNFPSRPED